MKNRVVTYMMSLKFSIFFLSFIRSMPKIISVFSISIISFILTGSTLVTSIIIIFIIILTLIKSKTIYKMLRAIDLNSDTNPLDIDVNNEKVKLIDDDHIALDFAKILRDNDAILYAVVDTGTGILVGDGKFILDKKYYNEYSQLTLDYMKYMNKNKK